MKSIHENQIDLGKSNLRSSNLFLAIVTFALLFFCLVFENDWISFSTSYLSWLVILFVTLVFFSMMFSRKRGLWALPVLYLLLFSFFHFGLVGSLAMNVTFSDYFLFDWLFDKPLINRAILYSFSGFLSFSLAVFVFSLLRRERAENFVSDVEKKDSLDSSVTFSLGRIFLLLGIGGWAFSSFLVGGWSIFTGSYGNYLELTKNQPMPLLYLLIGLGMVFLGAVPLGKKHIPLFVLFSFFGLSALLLGIRSVVLFPAMTFLCLVSKRRIVLSSGKAILLVIVFLGFMSALREIREVGIENIGKAKISSDPRNGLVEMGGSLYPVVEVIQWTRSGDSFLLGASYWAPIDRMLYHLLPFWDRIPGEKDLRLMNVLVMKRSGPIGFSPIAEAYYNFGVLGPCLVMFLFGLLLSFLENLPSSTLNQSLMGSIAIVLLYNVRNSFANVPGHLLIGFGCIGFLHILSSFKKISMRKPFLSQKNRKNDSF